MRNFNRLVEIAKSLKETYQNGKFFHVSFVLKGGKIIVTGFNNYNKQNNSSITYLPTKKADSANYIAGIHSENMVLGKIKHRTDCSDLTIVNVRINNMGEVSMSQPCPNCAYQIGRFGIKRVFFSTTNGFQKFKGV
jgi:deoxycytidylate deaminase